MDLVLHYGHCYSSTPFALSAPLEIEVEGFGRICVEKQGKRLPIHPFDPPRMSLKPDELSLSHLCCHQDHPERVQMMLSLALKLISNAVDMTPPSALQMAQRGLCAIGAANTQRLYSWLLLHNPPPTLALQHWWRQSNANPRLSGPCFARRSCRLSCRVPPTSRLERSS